MEITVEIIGMKAFKGVIDGKTMNGGCFYSAVRLDERYNKTDENGLNFKCGHAVEEWKVGDSELITRVAHLKPSKSNPVAMRLEIERVSNGRETSEVVMDARPVEVAKVAHVHAPATVRAA